MGYDSDSHVSRIGVLEAGSEVAGAVLAKILAQDEFSSVWTTEPLEEDFAPTCIRIIPATELVLRDARLRFRKELDFWQQMRSPHVVDMFDHGWDRGYYYMLMRHMPQGSLENMLDRSEDVHSRLVDFGISFAVALREVHGTSGAHGRLKPSNIFPDGARELRLSDFTIPLWLDEMANTDSSLRPRILHPYRAPEQHADPRDYDTRSDVYSFGLILLRCLSGRSPTLDGEAPHTVTQPWPSGLGPVVSQCLQRDPGMRPTDGYELSAMLHDATAYSAQASAEIEEEEGPIQVAAPQGFDSQELVLLRAPELLIREARLAMDRGQLEEAVGILEQLPDDADGMSEMLDEVEFRQRRSRELADEAVRLGELGRTDAAVDTIQQAYAMWSGSATVVAVRSGILEQFAEEQAGNDQQTSAEAGVPAALHSALAAQNYTTARDEVEKMVLVGSLTPPQMVAVAEFKLGRVCQAFRGGIKSARRLFRERHVDEAVECWREAARWLPSSPEREHLHRLTQSAAKGQLRVDDDSAASSIIDSDDAKISPSIRHVADLPSELRDKVEAAVATPEPPPRPTQRMSKGCALLVGVLLSAILIGALLLADHYGLIPDTKPASNVPAAEGVPLDPG